MPTDDFDLEGLAARSAVHWVLTSKDTVDTAKLRALLSDVISKGSTQRSLSSSFHVRLAIGEVPSTLPPGATALARYGGALVRLSETVRQNGFWFSAVAQLERERLADIGAEIAAAVAKTSGGAARVEIFLSIAPSE